jgi:alkanesulfonate monooxygenase SsuD/methylene tetrahydromethanopterin reductase-like flavin-dependent oxidoreductase (luciferase family)
VAAHAICVFPDGDVLRLGGFGPSFYQPMTTLAFVAGMTNRIMLGCSVVPIAYRHPIVQAKMIATLDQLSNGRGIYAGRADHLEPEFTALGLPYHERGKMADEYLQAIRTIRSRSVSRFVAAVETRQSARPTRLTDFSRNG